MGEAALISYSLSLQIEFSLLVMKKVALSIVIILFSVGASVAQQKQVPEAKTTSPPELLKGAWVIEDSDMLPTYLKEEYSVFLKDSLFFGVAATKTFGNTTKEKNINRYQYHTESKQLIIFNTSLEGIEYTVKNITADTLTFSIPNAQLNNYIDLVYKKVKEKDTVVKDAGATHSE